MKPRMTMLNKTRIAPTLATEWWDAAVGQSDGGKIVHIAACPDHAARVAPAAAAIAGLGVFEQRAVDMAPEPCVAATFRELGIDVAVRRLATDRAERPAALEDELMAAGCVALVVHDDGDDALTAALAAARRGITVVRIGGAVTGSRGRAIARLADLQLVFGEENAGTARRRVSGRLHVVGNPLVDTVRRSAREAVERAAWRRYGVTPGTYVLAVLAGDADPRTALALRSLAARVPLLVEATGRWPASEFPPEAQRVLAPGVIERLSLERAAGAIITDSARVQEEAVAVGVRCHTIGDMIPWPGTEVIVNVGRPGDLSAVRPAPHAPTPCAIPYWDGRAGARVAAVLQANFARLRFA